MASYEISSCWSSRPSKEDIQEQKLYKNIVEILLKNKDKIEYVESKLINNTTYHYFKYKNKEIDICKYNWETSADKYNLTVDDFKMMLLDELKPKKTVLSEEDDEEVSEDDNNETV